MSAPQYTVLEADFDPTRLRPGHYTAHSAFPAYHTLYALAVMPGSGVSIEWVQQHEGGMKQLFAHVPESLALAGSGRSLARNPEIGAAPAGWEASLQKWRADEVAKMDRPLKAYGNWRQAWWREAIQNATSPTTSGATTVELYVQETDRGYVVGCRDNGKGMDEDTLLNKLFAEAASGKRGLAGEPGGFGIAKEILFWPWIEYAVQSNGLIIRGKGDRITPPEKTEYRQGTTVEVLMPKDKAATAADAIAVVGACYLPHINFKVNGKVVHADFETGEDVTHMLPSWCQRQAKVYWMPLKRARKLPDGQYLQTKAALFVRDRGMVMFNRDLESELRGIIIVELVVPSVEVLTENRDDFNKTTSLRDCIESFLRDVQKDRAKLMAARHDVCKVFRAPLGKLSAFREAQVAAEANIMQAGVPKAAPQGKLELPPANIEAIAKLVESLAAGAAQAEQAQQRQSTPPPPQPVVMPSGELISEYLKGMRFTGQSHLEAALHRLTWPFDYIMASDDPNRRIERSGTPLAEYRRFYPDTMTPAVRRLINAWAETCRYIMMLLGCTAPFGVGFILSRNPDNDDVVLGQRRHQDGGDWLLLNPWKEGKEENGLLVASQDSGYIFSVALHECTHLESGIGHHHTAFATALTFNSGKAAQGYRRIKRIISLIRLPEDAPGGKEAGAPKQGWMDAVRSLRRHARSYRLPDKMPAGAATDAHEALRVLEGMLERLEWSTLSIDSQTMTCGFHAGPRGWTNVLANISDLAAEVVPQSAVGQSMNRIVVWRTADSGVEEYRLHLFTESRWGAGEGLSTWYADIRATARTDPGGQYRSPGRLLDVHLYKGSALVGLASAHGDREWRDLVSDVERQIMRLMGRVPPG